MSSVYNPENFVGRVNLAASYISSSRNTSRSFDTCFEMYDGDAVSTALYRRVQKNPSSKLAQNIWRYLSQNTVIPTALENAHRIDLTAWARELREQREAAWKAKLAEGAERTAQDDALTA
ncbi:hypothetical protein D2T29_12325 [Sinirhodobacter populi]|uniref:Uncharacterized protein n=1 Tax=Paenirhodobacter populi TaxID=2306993 RepID=A0A443KCC1_9RHOB|nr:hypothetical protein [Sinirhodobacter populi]RWR30451.1 hypothetical protein D2T29_12325 [Sinirhodobacter populi]